MKKYIYKITNTINNKIYIGQTNDIKRRFREHKNLMYGKVGNKHLYSAIKKYGLDSFIFEIIEETEDYNERENFWIDYYSTRNPDKGYNFDFNIEKNHRGRLNDKQIQEIICLLKEDILSYQEIADKYNLLSAQSIRDINRGVAYHQSNESYPIRLDRNTKAKIRAKNISEDLINSNMSFKELADKYNCSQTTISEINTGKKHRQEELEYPLRKNTKKQTIYSKEDIQNIQWDIQNTTLKWTELSEKYGGNVKVFQHINNGQTYFNPELDYPLRKTQRSTKITEETVSKIYDMLLNTNVSQKEIAQQLGCSSSVVNSVNVGRYHKKEEFSYPLRKR